MWWSLANGLSGNFQLVNFQFQFQFNWFFLALASLASVGIFSKWPQWLKRSWTSTSSGFPNGSPPSNQYPLTSLNIFQTIGNSQKRLRYLETRQDLKRSQILFSEGIFESKRWKGIFWVLNDHWDALRRLNRKRPLSYRARQRGVGVGGGRGVSYGHLYFPYSHPVTPVIRTHFEPHSVYAQYTQPYSHPTPDHHHHSYWSS